LGANSIFALLIKAKKMLTKISILNSKVYGKATIDLRDIDSLQLIGPNNIGKSTLIYALNFLFIIDGSKMSFSGGRKGNKETIDHYLPSVNQSYIVFEISKEHSYCILVKRDSDHELEYYKFETGFDDNIFFNFDNGIQRLLKFDEVKKNFENAGILLTPFKNKTEVFNAVYQRGANTQAAVWLEDTVKSDGLSNNFSKVYRYLINSKLINNKSLKESLIIADNRENDQVNFSQKNKKELSDLLRINDEIKNIKSIANDFASFREVVNQYYGKIDIISGLKYAFIKNYRSTVPQLDDNILKREKEVQKIQNDLHEVLEPQNQELNRKIGQKEFEITAEIEIANNKTSLINEIKKYDDIDLLKQQQLNYDKQRKEIEAHITTIENQNLNSLVIENKVNALNNNIQQLEQQVKNYKNLLIHKISDNEEDRKLLNSIFSNQVSMLTADTVKKKVGKTSKKILKIFDGEIDISKNIKIENFKSVDEIKADLKQLKAELKANENLLAVAKDIESANKLLVEIIKKIDEVKDKIKKIKQIPNLEKELNAINNNIKSLKAEKEKLEKELQNLNREIVAQQSMLESLQDGKRKLEERKRELYNHYQEIDEIALETIEIENNDSLDVIYSKIKLFMNDIAELKASKDKTFVQLKYKTNNNLANEKDFIDFVEDELACLNDKEKSIDGLLSSISTQFANPAYQILKRYEEFKQFVYNKFNAKLSKTRISDIESLKIELEDNNKIINELRLISEIQDINGQLMLQFDQTENLKALNNFLDTGRKVSFDELFDIGLQLESKGNTKKVDLANQVESDGTDRMIRLIIIMSIINRLAITSPENKIALFIDEVATIDKQNRPELVNFCKEHNFIPIFAAPDAIPGFNKYYFIYPNKGKININENLHTAYSSENTPTSKVVRNTKNIS
jgi:hypothetical protein